MNASERPAQPWRRHRPDGRRQPDLEPDHRAHVGAAARGVQRALARGAAASGRRSQPRRAGAQPRASRLAVGEHVYSALAFRDFLEAGALGYVQADCTRLAGVTEWLQVAALAKSFNVPVVPHHADMMRVHQHLSAGVNASPDARSHSLAAGRLRRAAGDPDGYVYPPEHRVPRPPSAPISSRSTALPEVRAARRAARRGAAVAAPGARRGLARRPDRDSGATRPWPAMSPSCPGCWGS